MQECTLLLHQMDGTQNRVAEALSKRAHILGSIGVEVPVEFISKEYYDDPIFKKVIYMCAPEA